LVLKTPRLWNKTNLTTGVEKKRKGKPVRELGQKKMHLFQGKKGRAHQGGGTSSQVERWSVGVYSCGIGVMWGGKC